MTDAAPNNEVMFLPENTFLLQPMNQGMISAFKVYYQQRVMSQLLQAISSSDQESIKTFRCGYNIKNAIDTITAAWDEVRDTIMNGVWKNLWPVCVHSFRFSQVKKIVGEILGQSHKASFDKVDDSNVEELLQSHQEGLALTSCISWTSVLHMTSQRRQWRLHQWGSWQWIIFGRFFTNMKALDFLKELDPNAVAPSCTKMKRSWHLTAICTRPRRRQGIRPS